MVYYPSQSTVRPDPIDTTSSPTTVYFHRNITQHTDEDGTVIYDYEEAKMPRSEYVQYLADKNQADLEYLYMMTGVEYYE